MSNEDLLPIVCGALEEFNKEGVLLGQHTDITAELSIDSPSILEVLFELEEKLDISIPIDSLADISTIGELCTIIKQIMDEG